VRDADGYERIRTSVPRVPWNREQKLFPRLATHSLAFRNDGQLGFSNASGVWKFGRDSSISQGIALGDLDGDGDLDVVVTRLDDTPLVYRNDGAAPRVAVRLRGESANVDGIGARVIVRANGLPAQSREMTAGGYYLSGSETVLAFAAGDARDSAIAIEVRWRPPQRHPTPCVLYSPTRPHCCADRRTRTPCSTTIADSRCFRRDSASSARV
jgi:hypothetical protein